MRIRVRGNSFTNVPSTQKWVIPYLRRASEAGYRLPERVMIQEPARNRRVRNAAHMGIYGNLSMALRGNRKVIPNSWAFLYTRDNGMDRGFYKPTMLKNLAHELAHLQEKASLDHGELHSAYEDALTEIFMTEYNERKRLGWS